LSSGSSKSRTFTNDIGLSRFKLNGRLSIMTAGIEIFAETAFLPLFKKSNLNPSVYPTTIGLSFPILY
tara:strand:+ start:128 stop:331 length:204 start_codon:yes stop_codon:yes gene_type:complete